MPVSHASSARIVASGTAKAAPLPFDVCNTGVVLRAMLLVVVSVLTTSLFIPVTYAGWKGWLLHAGLGLACAQPGALLWLVVVCTAKRWLARQPQRVQWGCCIVLGMGCGLFSGALLASVREVPWSVWAGCVLAGGLLAALLVSLLMLRWQLQAPGNVQAQLAELQARIRPHFLFNALNSAIALVRVDPARAEMVLENLGDLFRHMLQDVRHASTLGDEIELARRYLAIEEVRFGERLRVRWDIDPAASLASMPTLILQPLLENAIRHGVEPSQQGADVLIRTMMRGNEVRVIVSNTFPGGTGKPGNGMALENVRRRLFLLHDMGLGFSAKVVGDRFLVRIAVPMQVQEDT